MSSLSGHNVPKECETLLTQDHRGDLTNEILSALCLHKECMDELSPRKKFTFELGQWADIVDILDDAVDNFEELEAMWYVFVRSVDLSRLFDISASLLGGGNVVKIAKLGSKFLVN